MRYAFRHLLLVALFLLAQAGALAHELGHALEQTQPDEPVCELCLAYAPMGAGVASTLPAWSAPASILVFDTPLPATSPTGFRPIYQSRAPPSTC
jgi:hypothetical protein